MVFYWAPALREGPMILGLSVRLSVCLSFRSSVTPLSQEPLINFLDTLHEVRGQQRLKREGAEFFGKILELGKIPKKGQKWGKIDP